MAILWTIIIGFIVGLLARFLKPGNDSMGFIFTTIVGIMGAFLGGFLGRVLGLYQQDQPAGFIGALVGAIILLFILQFFAGKKTA